MAAKVSSQCQGSMHMACNDWDCGCTECHKVCSTCSKKCRVTFTFADSDVELCSVCYNLETIDRPRPRCEGCSAPYGYRDPREGNDFLCTACHKARGHRFQDHGRWVQTVPVGNIL
jgi:hypothetical protein